MNDNQFASKGRPPLTIEEVEAIVIAEKEYWDKADPMIGMAASGACCNIFAALYGLRAPWHPQVNPTPTPTCPDSAWRDPASSFQGSVAEAQGYPPDPYNNPGVVADHGRGL